MKRIAAFMILMVMIAVLAAAQPAAPPCAGSRDLAKKDQTEPKLALSDAQEKAIKELRLLHRKELIPLRGELEIKELDLRAEMMVEKPNMARIYALVDEIAKGRAEIEKKNITLRFKIREQLTPEQRKIWDEQKGRGRDGVPAGPRGGKGMSMMRGFRGMHGPGLRPPLGMESPGPDMDDDR